MSERASDSPTQGDERFLVVRNDEDQYSIWQHGRELPAGWHDTGFAGTRNQCLSQVDDVWTDMRPKSLREVTT